MPRTSHELIKELVESWPEFAEGDEPVSGTDLVGWFAGFYATAVDCLENEEGE